MVIRKKTIGIWLACFIILWLNSGIFDFITDRIPMVAKFGAVFVWFCIACTTDRYYLGRYIRTTLPIFIVLLMLIISNLLGRSNYYNAYFMMFVYLAIIQALFAFYFFSCDKENLKLLLAVFFLDVGVVTVRTFMAVLQNPIVVRAISTSVQMRKQLLPGFSLKGIGGYGLCYQLAFLTPCIAYLFNEKLQRNMVKVLLYAVLVYLLSQFQITLALLFAVTFIICSEFIRTNKKNTLGYFLKLITWALMIFLVVNFNAIIKLAIQYANPSLAERLNELLLIQSVGVEGTSDFRARLQLYTTSIMCFLNNPVLGSFGGSGFGAHSTFLDIIAAFGVIGFVGIYGICGPLTILYNAFRKGTVARRYLFWVIMVFAIFATINVALWSDILLMCNLMIPLFFKVVAENQ